MKANFCRGGHKFNRHRVVGAEPTFTAKKIIGKVELNRTLAATGFKVRSADFSDFRCNREIGLA